MYLDDRAVSKLVSDTHYENGGREPERLQNGFHRIDPSSCCEQPARVRHVSCRFYEKYLTKCCIYKRKLALEAANWLRTWNAALPYGANETYNAEPRIRKTISVLQNALKWFSVSEKNLPTNLKTALFIMILFTDLTLFNSVQLLLFEYISRL